MQTHIKDIAAQIAKGDFRALARGITIVENGLAGAEELLSQPYLPTKAATIGITGPPGAGKSTLTDGLLGHWLQEGKMIAVLAVDPSSPFNFGALLGDRIRLNKYYNHPQVYIRSLSSRGALGGLHPNIWEIVELILHAPFDYLIVETVGVGQSEVDIAGLADCTIVTLVPEAGDEVQTIKAGVMEIGDVFAINKADRPGVDAFYAKMKLMLHERITEREEPVVIKTIGTTAEGITELSIAIKNFLESQTRPQGRRLWMLASKIWQHIQHQKMKDISKAELIHALKNALLEKDFNWMQFAKNYA